ncbi:MAG: TetR/AcrR family transcriptional regulator [Actinomycetota bacterium]|nr:TetR/AcrR family transcriptional regulator [Actinomycetota bacterium]
MIDAAFDELTERGYERVTMQGIARRAGASKETLYSWFGNREGLFAALIEENAAASAERVEAALTTERDPRDTLVGFATGLLRLLTSERSVVLNRAAMGSPELARVLLASGRHRLGPLVERYLERLAARSLLRIDDADDAFRLLYGLVVQDAQIRTLLGEDPPSPAEIDERAARAVDRFLTLVGT